MTKLKWNDPPKDRTHIRKGPGWGYSKKPEEGDWQSKTTSTPRDPQFVSKSRKPNVWLPPKKQPKRSIRPMVRCQLCGASVRAPRYKMHIAHTHGNLSTKQLPRFSAKVARSFIFHWNGRNYKPPIGVEGSIAWMGERLLFAPYGAIDECGNQICIQIDVDLVGPSSLIEVPTALLDQPVVSVS